MILSPRLQGAHLPDISQTTDWAILEEVVKQKGVVQQEDGMDAVQEE